MLELGIVRDSVLNATNSYQIFGESWENAAGIGVESLWITSTVCPDGSVTTPATAAGEFEEKVADLHRRKVRNLAIVEEFAIPGGCQTPI